MTEESKTSNAQTDDGDKEPLKVTFSLPQILGGALAAATAATIGSTLGVAGTIIGASVASVIGGVAGTLYSAGLDRTHRQARTAMKRVYSRVRVAEPSDGETAATAEGMPEAPDEVAAKTEVLAVDAPTVSEGSEARRDWRPILKRMAITVVAIFVVTLGVITAIELGLGSSLDGSGGTTVGQVTVPKSRPTPTATETVTVMPTPAASPTGPAPSASQTPSFSPTPEPSTSGGSELPTATAS